MTSRVTRLLGIVLQHLKATMISNGRRMTKGAASGLSVRG